MRAANTRNDRTWELWMEWQDGGRAESERGRSDGSSVTRRMPGSTLPPPPHCHHVRLFPQPPPLNLSSSPSPSSSSSSSSSSATSLLLPSSLNISLHPAGPGRLVVWRGSRVRTYTPSRSLWHTAEASTGRWPGRRHFHFRRIRQTVILGFVRSRRYLSHCPTRTAFSTHRPQSHGSDTVCPPPATPAQISDSAVRHHHHHRYHQNRIQNLHPTSTSSSIVTHPSVWSAHPYSHCQKCPGLTATTYPELPVPYRRTDN